MSYEDLNRRLSSLYSRGKVSHADVFEGIGSHQAEYRRGEVRRTEAPMMFGLAAQPLPGAEIHALFDDGQRDSPVAFSVADRRYSLIDLKAGEVALYGPAGRALPYQWVKMTADPKPGTIKVKAARIEIRAGEFYVLVDSDPAIGSQKGSWPAEDELPLNPHGAAL